MAKRNEKRQIPASKLESDDCQRTTAHRMPNRHTGHSSGGRSGRGTTVTDGAAPGISRFNPIPFTETDHQEFGGGVLSKKWEQTPQKDSNPFLSSVVNLENRTSPTVRCNDVDQTRGGSSCGADGKGFHQFAPVPFASTMTAAPLQVPAPVPAPVPEPVPEPVPTSYPVQFLPHSFEFIGGLDYLQDEELYAAPPPATQPLTSGQDFQQGGLLPLFVMDQMLSSTSSSSSSEHSFSSFPTLFGVGYQQDGDIYTASTTLGQGLPGDNWVPLSVMDESVSSSSSDNSINYFSTSSVPLMDAGQVQNMAEGFGEMKLDDMETDGTGMTSNQSEDIYAADPESAEPANQIASLIQQNEDGDTILHQSIIYGFGDHHLAALIQIYRDLDLLNVENNLRQTPLHLATIMQRDDVIGRLLENGAKRQVSDRSMDTPLHIACRKGHVTCVRALVPAKKDRELEQELRDLVESPNKEGQNCLHVAAINDRLEIVRYLIEDCRVNVNSKELRRGRTILHLAIERRNSHLVHYLLNLPDHYELLIDELTYDGYSALDMAQLMSLASIEALLHSKDNNQSSVTFHLR